MNVVFPPSARSRRALAAILVALAPGCSGDGRPPRFPATGKVLVDGEPRAGIRVRLSPADRLRDVDALSPVGVTDERGVYRLGTFEDADGAPAGRYKASLFWPDIPPGQGRPKDQLLGKYDDPAESGFELTVAEGDNDLGSLEVAKGAAPVPRRGAGKNAQAPDPDGDAPPPR